MTEPSANLQEVIKILSDLPGNSNSIGFHNVDPSLKRYRVRLNGVEVGPEMSWTDCEAVTKWFRGMVGKQMEFDHG